MNKRGIRIIWLVAGIGTLLLAYSGVSNRFGFHNSVPRLSAPRIAHAGGAIGHLAVTNSYNALNFNFDRGFRYFELDFSLTRDGNYVCLHD
jgi:hypothetical protein